MERGEDGTANTDSAAGASPEDGSPEGGAGSRIGAAADSDPPEETPDAAPEPPTQEIDGEAEEEVVRLEGERLRACLEAILFASPEPVSRRKLYRLLREADKAEIREALLELEGELLTTHRGYHLVEEAAGFRLLTKAEFAPFVARLRGEKRRIRLSAAAFETLAVIAYRQPVRRADLEAIRGVQSGAILKNLMEWGLIRVIGHDDAPGRPLLYGTTSEFLELLGLSRLEDLPEPERLRERGADRGLEVLDRIIEEGGGPPVLAEDGEDAAGESADPPAAVGEPRGDTEEAPAPEVDDEAGTPGTGAGADFDLDLGDDEDERAG